MINLNEDPTWPFIQKTPIFPATTPRRKKKAKIKVLFTGQRKSRERERKNREVRERKLEDSKRERESEERH